MSMERRTALDHVLFSISEEEYRVQSLDQVRNLAKWLADFGVSKITVDVRDAPELGESLTHGDVECNVVAADGKVAVVESLRSLASEISGDSIDIDDFERSAVERRLEGEQEVDLVVKTGQQRLVNSAIYDTVYSEVRFVDSWLTLDRRQIEQLVEDFSDTERRYGR